MTILPSTEHSNWNLINERDALSVGSYYGFRTVPTRSEAQDTSWTLPLVLRRTGTGVPPMRRNIIPYGHLDGAYYQGGVYMPRVFFLQLLFMASTWQALQQDIAAWQGRFMPADREAITLQYVGEAQTLEIDAVLEAGLEKPAAQDAPAVRQDELRFLAYTPFWRAAEVVTATLDVRDSLSNANNLLERTSAGWVAHNANAEVNVVKYIDGVLWAGGQFTTVGGVSASYIAYYDESLATWVEPGDGLNGYVFDILRHPNGGIIVVGAFDQDSLGGVTGLNGVAEWDGAAWQTTYSPSTLGSSGAVLQAVLGYDGKLYVGGSMVGFDGGIDYVARLDPGGWAQPGSAIDHFVYGLAVGLDGYIYARGSFTGYGAYWDKSSWTTMGTLAYGAARIKLGPDGALWSTDGSGGAALIRWNGQAWETIYEEASRTFTLAEVTPDRDIWVNGWGAEPLVWRNGVWATPSWYLTVTLALNDVDYAADGLRVAFAYGNTGTPTARTEGTTSVTYSGDTPVQPTVAFSGPGDLYSLRNLTTGKVIYFQNLTLLDGETATLDLAAGTFTSDWRGDLSWAIDMASDFATFQLHPGTNVIMTFIDDSSASAEMSWQPLSLGLESAD